MQFGNEIAAVLLVLAVLIAAFVWRYEKHARRRRLSELGDLSVIQRLLPQEVFHRQNSLALTFLFLFFTCLALARPQWGFTFRETTKRGVDIAIAFDVSESMRVEDVKPNRLERGRREIYDLIDRLKGDRVGLVTFAGAAFVEMPMTLDYSALKQFVSALGIGSVPLQGTNIELAIQRCLELLGVKGEHVSAKRSRAILLITDGEALDGNLKRAAAELKKTGTHLYVLGLGTPTGGPIPLEDGLKQDSKGQTVISKLNENALQEFAKSSEGMYVPETTTDADLRAIYDEGIKKRLVEDNLSGANSRIWNEYFQIPLAFALLFLLFGVWREKPSRTVTASVVGVSCFFLLLPGFVSAAEPSAPEAHRLEGKVQFEHGNFDLALKEFELAKNAEEAGEAPRQLAIGASLYRLKKFEEAQSAFKAAATHAKDKQTQAEALYNSGNSQVQLGQYQAAVTTYKEALKINPGDKETQENLKYAEKLLQQQQEEEKKKDEEKKDKQKEEQDKKESKQKSDQPEQGGKEKEDQEQKSEDSQDEQKQSEAKEKQPQDSKDNKTSPQNDATATPSPSPQPSQAPSPEPSPGGSEDAKPEEPESDSQAQESPTPLPSPSPSPGASPGKDESEKNDSESGEQSEDAPEPSQESKKPLTADEQALETLLQSVEEKYTPDPLYRLRESLRQLEKLRQEPPSKDW